MGFVNFTPAGVPNYLVCGPLITPAYVDYTSCYIIDFMSTDLMVNTDPLDKSPWNSECRLNGNYAIVRVSVSSDASGVANVTCCPVTI
jgi:hypothetical protein